MSLEEIGQRIKEANAVKNFDVLKEQLTKALSDNVKVAEKAKECAINLEEEKREREKLRRKKKGSDRARKKAEQELKEARGLIAELTEELGHLANLKSNWEGKTLTEVIVFEQKEREEEIARRSEERLRVIKDGWEKNEKPVQVREEAISALRRILAVLQTPGPHYSTDGGPEGEIAETVTDLLDSRIKQKAEIDFLSRGKELAERMTKSMFDLRKKEVWSKYVEERMGSSLQELQTQIITTFAKFIEREFIVSCDKCGTENAFNLTSDGVEELIRRGYTSFRCANETCRDLFGRHDIRVSLRDLIKARLHLADQPPA